MAKPLNILITGGAGFLGWALSKNLDSLGYDVKLLLRPTSNRSRLKSGGWDNKICTYESDADILNIIQEITPDIIIHTACQYENTGNQIVAIADSNIRFGLLILQSSLQLNKPICFVNIGTSLPVDLNLYALSKHQFAAWGKNLAANQKNQLKFVNINLQNMYGPDDDPTRFAGWIIDCCLNNKPVIDLTEGCQKRDFIYIDDVVSGIATVVKNLDQLQKQDEIDLGSGQIITIRYFTEMVYTLTKAASKIRFGVLPYRQNEKMVIAADISKLTSFGWRPKTSLQKGLETIIENYRLK